MKAGAYLLMAAGLILGFVLGSSSTLQDRDVREFPLAGHEAAERKAENDSPRLGEAKRVFSGGDGLRDLARVSVEISGFDSDEIANLLDWLEAGEFGQSQGLASSIFESWLKRDPEAARAWLRPRLLMSASDPIFRDPLREKFFNSWVKLFPEEAADFAMKHSRSDLAKHLLQGVFWNWSADDADGKLAKMRSVFADLPPGLARKALTETLFANWGSSNPAEALACADGLENPIERSRALGFVFKMWPTEQVEQAIDAYQRLQMDKPELLIELMGRVAKSDWRRGIDVAANLDAETLVVVGPFLAEEWARTEPIQALEWTIEKGIPLSSQRPKQTTLGHGSMSTSMPMGASVLTKAMAADPVAVTRWIANLTDESQRTSMASAALGTLGLDPQMAVDLFRLLPAESRSWGAGVVASRFSANPEEGVAWCATLPAGPVRERAWQTLGWSLPVIPDGVTGSDRDAFLVGYVKSAPLSYSSSGAIQDTRRWDLIMEIQDPVLRHDVFETVIGGALDAKSESKSRQARAWLEKANVPEDWKQKWHDSAAN